jgi:hypothetical protein
MDLDNQAADSGLASGNAGGETRIETTPQAAPSGLSLKDSLANAATKVRERTENASPAREAASGTPTALETKPTQPRSPQDQAGSQESPASDILEAPKHWPQKRRDAFGRFMSQPDLQREWLEHTKELEGEFTRKSQEQAEARKFADSVRELFAPHHRQQMQASGMDERGAINHLLSLHDYAAKDPAGYAKWFMQQAGIQPQQLFPEIGQAQPQSPGNPAEAEWVDPEIIKLREELGALKAAQQQQLQQQQAYLRSQEEARRTQVQTTIGSEIERFSTAKDETGNPLHPYFAEVEERMAWEFETNPELKNKPVTQEALKHAYEVAVWANPTTRQTMLEAQKAAEQGELARRQAAEKARAAQTLKPKLGSSAGVTKVPPSDLRSLVRDAASRAKG